MIENIIPALFKENNRPIHLSPSQIDIYKCIYNARPARVQIIAPTQYGKSLTVALSILVRILTTNDRFIILAPSDKKAKIIMSYLIDHCFDHPQIIERLELDSNENLDRLRRERSRNNITFKGGGGVMTLTLDARNSKRSIESAMGFGGNRIILDESSLIDDTLYATVKRMLGGYDIRNQFLLEIGNPFYRNHFHRTWHSSRYKKIFIDYKQGLKEGRYSNEFIEEMREEAFFDVFYECKFPDEDYVDENGYRTLITLEKLEKSYTDTHIVEGELRLGVDVGGGGDSNVYVMRNDNIAWIENSNRSSDTMTNVTEIVNMIDKYNIEHHNVYIDDIGIGRGVSDRLKEMGYNVTTVTAGGKAINSEKYKNIKAENYWNTRSWILAGAKLVKNDQWQQLNWVKYKVSTDKQLQIEPKEELKRRRGKSPDYAEALMLTFATPDQFLFNII